MRILTAEAMREVDRRAIEELGVPGLVLMENAALGVVDALAERFPEAESAALFCGPGNNGGDGLAIARHLAVRGYDPRVFLVFGGREPGGDAGVQLAICRRMGLALAELDPSSEEELVAALAAARGCDLVVDALFGTGLGRPLAGGLAALVEGLNELPLPRLAVDIPSGLHGSRADLPGPHLRAHLTVTFAAPKVAHVFPPAADAVGELVVADLGVPPRLVDEAHEAHGELHLLVDEELAPLLPARRPDSHKGDYGHALLVAGSPGKAGAAVLAARAAVRAGAGLVTAAVPAPLLATVDLGSLESMTLALPATTSGQLAAAAVDAVREALAGKQALAVGPGLGQEEETAAAIRRLVLSSDAPLVLDADGLNAFAGRARELAGRSDALLTPHPGEMGRLLGIATAEVQADRPAAARRAAAETGAVVVLKGHLSLVAAPSGEVWVNPTGNPGMASGGSGDVLTGLLAALLAQGLDPLSAARLGVYLHGLAGDLAAGLADGGEGDRSTGGAGAPGWTPPLAASDLLDRLPAAFRRLAGAGPG
jgi:ADP-dependent NAD(P)H-hydrate dehydratase / NAD(P)H-hydrate epimerase